MTPPDPFDRYSADVLADYSRRPARAVHPEIMAEFDLVVEEVQSDFCGSVVRVDGRTVELEDRKGARRVFPLGGGFLFEGRPVRLVAPRDTGVSAPKRSASGSVAAGNETRARVARASRIFVEGKHDAQLVEKVWGDDLRSEGVVVVQLDGADHLDDVLADFAPDGRRRAGVLLDHLVPGSKEQRIADAATRRHPGRVLVVGHPFVDVWQSVTPVTLGITAWPVIPRGIEWKRGICAHFGWPHEDPADIARAWQRILGRVSTYADLEPSLLGRVEELIDFVTASDSD